MKKDILLKGAAGGVVGAVAYGYINKSNNKSLLEGLGRGSLLGSSICVAINYENVNKLYNAIQGTENIEPNHQDRLREINGIHA